MLYFVGANVYPGGCFFTNMLVELSGQSETMSGKVLKSFLNLSKLFQSWLKEAEAKRLIRSKLNHQIIADHIMISMNGAAVFYGATRNSSYLKNTVKHLKQYIDNLKS